MVIDDDEFLREVIATTLTQAGHTVYQASDGREGCAMFHATPADLVLTDIIMPGQEGIETIIKLHLQHPALPIIAMSGGATHSKLYLDISAKLGARRVLAKPFTPAELNRAIVESLPATAPPPEPPLHALPPS